MPLTASAADSGAALHHATDTLTRLEQVLGILGHELDAATQRVRPVVRRPRPGLDLGALEQLRLDVEVGAVVEQVAVLAGAIDADVEVGIFQPAHVELLGGGSGAANGDGRRIAEDVLEVTRLMQGKLFAVHHRRGLEAILLDLQCLHLQRLGIDRPGTQQGDGRDQRTRQ